MGSILYAVTPPAAEPVTLAEAQAACHVDVTAEDAFISRLIASARQWAEAYTSRAFVPQTWELRRSCFASLIELPRPPLVSVSSVKYLDTAGALQTLASDRYTVHAPAGDYAPRGTIEAAYGVAYPSTHPVAEAVRIEFVAGYAPAVGAPAAAAVPAGVKAAILAHVAESYQNRERPDYGAAELMLWPWAEVRFD